MTHRDDNWRMIRGKVWAWVFEPFYFMISLLMLSLLSLFNDGRSFFLGGLQNISAALIQILRI